MNFISKIRKCPKSNVGILIWLRNLPYFWTVYQKNQSEKRKKNPFGFYIPKII